MKPCFTTGGVHYCWIKYRNIYLVSVAKRNPNLSMVFSFLHKLKDILVDYFQELEEESIRDNFVLIYELLDEIMDHGYPQTTDSKILKEFIKTSSYKMSKSLLNSNNQNTMKNIGQISTGLTRPEGIKYKVNKAYLDVIEQVNSLVSYLIDF